MKLEKLPILPLTLLAAPFALFAQTLQIDPSFYPIIEAISPDRLEADVQTLANFGTRHTMSETDSDTRGIGAARRWIKAEFEAISADHDNAYEVHEQRTLVTADPDSRIDRDTEIVNIYAIKRGSVYPNRYIIMSGDIDSRVSDVMNYTDDSPGANDNATGMAAAIELARVLADRDFPCSILLAGLSGEEQGLFGGKHLAEKAKSEGWEIIGVLNNDMIGNIEGIDGVIDNRSFRIFSEPYYSNTTEREFQLKRFYGGENDGESRQLARYVHATTQAYLPELKPMLIYRLDRFGRGGHHRPFNEAGFPGIRIMETHENYNRQHQDLRIENGITYGDTIDGVDFDYCAKLTAVNAIALAALASAPLAPANVQIGGIVQADTTLRWQAKDDPHIAGYKVYWRDTTSPIWQYARLVGKTDSHTLKGIVIDNYLFGVSAIGSDGHESVVTYPSSIIRD
ncbi:peptidase, M28 family [Verrucomicrobiia bacterium DG1235]|nr:peptidase, M28 family [Verrucomicrobiae bacterium DG1235]